MKIDNILECNGKKISNAFGKYFSNVEEKFAKRIPNPKKGINEYLSAIRQNNLSLFFSPCTRTELKKMIGKLPSKNSSGHDNVSNTLLKEISDVIIEPLLIIFNQSLAKGIFPTIMKIADIVPLHKGKERYLETNYRPISLLTTLSKLLEKVVCTRVYNFLDNTGQIVSTQYGFRANHSCDQAISHLVGNIIKNIENKQITIGLFLDLSKAFDTLEHKIVLEKMKRYGIRGTCLSWFESYLTNRQMRVKCTPTSTGKTTLSDLYTVSYGAPQGSCLGPLIFLIFCNDLQLHLQFMACFQFADDTTLLMGHRNKYYLKYCVEIDLLNIQDWFYANKLTLNIDKTVYLIFNRPNFSDFKLELGGVTIPRGKVVKFLGTWIDEDLSWGEHITKLSLKLGMKLGLLHRSKNFLPVHAMKTLYYAQFHSILTYAMSAWGSMITPAQIRCLQSLQDKAVKTIEKNQILHEIYQKYQLLSVKQLIRLHELKFGYKVCLGLLPAPLEDCVTSNHLCETNLKQHQYNTRQKNIPNLPSVKNSLYHRSILFTSVKAISQIPGDLRNTKPFKQFVVKCKKYLLTDKQF